MAKVQRGKKGGRVANSDLRSYGNLAKRSLKTSLNKSNDTGLQAASTAVSSAELAVKAYKVEQKVQGAVVRTAPKVVKTTAKAIKTVVVTGAKTGAKTVKVVRGIKSGDIKVGQALKNALVNNAVARNARKAVNTVSTATKKTVRVVRGIKSGEIKVGKIVKAAIVKRAKDVGNAIKVAAAIKLVKAEVAVKKAVNTVKSGVAKTVHGVTVVKGILTGKIKLSPQQVKNLIGKAVKNTAKVTAKTAKAAGKATLKTATVVSKVGLKTAIPTGKAAISVGSVMGNSLINSGDTGLQAAGAGLKTVQHAPKAMKTTVKAGLKTGKVAVKTTKTTVRGIKGAVKGVKFIGKNGFKATGKRAGQSVAKGTGKLAAKATQAAFQAVRGAIVQVLAPVAVMLIISAVMVSVTVAPIAAVGSLVDKILSIFGIGGETIEIDVGEELNKQVKAYRDAFVEKIVTTAFNQVGTYHFIQFEDFTPPIRTDSDYDVIDAKIYELANSKIASGEEYVGIIEPFFSTIMMMNYDAPSQGNVDSEIYLLWSYFDKDIDDVNSVTGKGNANIVVTELPVTYCGTAHSCGGIHKSSNCPNVETGNHTGFTCESCCVNKIKYKDNPAYPTRFDAANAEWDKHERLVTEYNDWCTIDELYKKAPSNGAAYTQYYNNNIKWREDNYKIAFGRSFNSETKEGLWLQRDNSFKEYQRLWSEGNAVPEKIEDGVEFDKCNGYSYCAGHRTCKISIVEADFDTLMRNVFDNPIQDLENKNPRTIEEEDRLQELKDWKDVTVELKEYWEEERKEALKNGE